MIFSYIACFSYIKTFNDSSVHATDTMIKPTHTLYTHTLVTVILLLFTMAVIFYVLLDISLCFIFVRLTVYYFCRLIQFFVVFVTVFIRICCFTFEGGFIFQENGKYYFFGMRQPTMLFIYMKVVLVCLHI